MLLGQRISPAWLPEWVVFGVAVPLPFYRDPPVRFWMGRPRSNRWVIMATLAVGAVLAGSLLIGIQTSQAKRWDFGGDFTVTEVDVSRAGEFFITVSRPPGGPSSGTVLHYFTGERVFWNTTIDDDVSALALASSGSLVVVGRAGGGVDLMSGRGEPLGHHDTQGPVIDVESSADGGFVAVAAPLEPRANARGGLLLYRLGHTAPMLHVPKADIRDVALSDDGQVVGLAAGTDRATQVLLYDREIAEDRPQLVETLPGRFTAMSLSGDGRHMLVVTQTAAFLLSREHARPVGMVPEEPSSETQFSGGILADDGQSYLLANSDASQVGLYKWGESDPRWTHKGQTTISRFHIDTHGARVVLLDEAGMLSVLSVTTGRPIKQFILAGGPQTSALSADGSIVLASDDAGLLYRARSGYSGLLGILPDPIVSTLYAQPPFFLWFGILVSLTLVTYPTALPLVKRYVRRTGDHVEEPDPIPVEDLDALVAQTPRRVLDGPVVVRDLVVRRQNATLLDGVDLDAAVGSLTAIVGGSGEGKSTLLRALVGRGIVAGTVRLGTIDPKRDQRRMRDAVGFVAQDLQVYESLSPLENLAAFGGQFQLSAKRLDKDAKRLLRIVGLDPETRRPVHRLSGGERRRVSIAATLLHGPRILILDEPTTGLDPLTRRRLWGLLRDLRERLQVTILVSTHYLEEAEAADNVVVVERGRVLACGAPDSVVQSAPGGPTLWRLVLDDPQARRGAALQDAVAATFERHDDGERVRDIEVSRDDVLLRLANGPSDAGAVLQALRKGGFEIARDEWIRMSFEDAFIAHIGEARRDVARDALAAARAAHEEAAAMHVDAPAVGGT